MWAADLVVYFVYGEIVIYCVYSKVNYVYNYLLNAYSEVLIFTVNQIMIIVKDISVKYIKHILRI